MEKGGLRGMYCTSYWIFPEHSILGVCGPIISCISAIAIEGFKQLEKGCAGLLGRLRMNLDRSRGCPAEESLAKRLGGWKNVVFCRNMPAPASVSILTNGKEFGDNGGGPRTFHAGVSPHFVLAHPLIHLHSSWRKNIWDDSNDTPPKGGRA